MTSKRAPIERDTSLCCTQRPAPGSVASLADQEHDAFILHPRRRRLGSIDRLRLAVALCGESWLGIPLGCAGVASTGGESLECLPHSVDHHLIRRLAQRAVLLHVHEASRAGSVLGARIVRAIRL